MDELMNALALNKNVSDRDVWSVNGLDGQSGWQLLSKLRKETEAKDGFEPQMVVVKTSEILVRFGGAGPHRTIDLMQVRGEKKSKIYYWYEISDHLKGVVKDRKCVDGFEASVFPVGVKQELRAIIACAPEKYDELVELMRRSQAIKLQGMWVDASMGKKEQGQFFVVQELETVDEDYSGGENILKKLKDWTELIPMRHYYTEKPLFDEVTSLSMLVSVMFTRMEMAAFNTIYFGPSRHGKTAVLRFLVCDVLKGGFESATASAGKGWLVSHKEGTPPSKLFSERKCLLVDELFKSVSVKGEHRSYAIALKALVQGHMQILDRGLVDASSGVGRVKGEMICSFVGTENDDLTLQVALAKAESISDAAFRRIQIGYAERAGGISDDSFDQVDVDAKAAKQKMIGFFIKKFGQDALKDIASLLLYSRRYTEKWSPESEDFYHWQIGMYKWMYHCAYEGLVGFPEFDKNYVGAEEIIAKKLKSMVHLQRDCVRASYISAAIVRGWEVASSYKEFKPVVDLRQQKLAEQLVMYFFRSRVRIFEPGLKDLFIPRGGGISRGYGGRREW